MTVRDAILANDELAKHGNDRAARRRNALMAHARHRGVTVRELADMLHIGGTCAFEWSGGRLDRGAAALDDQAPNELCPPPDAPAPIPGQATIDDELGPAR